MESFKAESGMDCVFNTLAVLKLISKKKGKYYSKICKHGFTDDDILELLINNYPTYDFNYVTVFDTQLVDDKEKTLQKVLMYITTHLKRSNATVISYLSNDEFGHVFILYKDEYGDIFVYDPQKMYTIKSTGLLFLLNFFINSLNVKEIIIYFQKDLKLEERMKMKK